MICRACGRVVPDDSLYCPQCGTPLEKVNTNVNETANNNANANSANNGYYNANANVNAKEQEEAAYIAEKLNKGRLYGIISIVCSILGLGSFGSLDVVAIICGYLGLKQLKSVPKDYPDKSVAVTLNRAGIICSAGLIIAGGLAILICLIAFPWVFGALASGLAGLMMI